MVNTDERAMSAEEPGAFASVVATNEKIASVQRKWPRMALYLPKHRNCRDRLGCCCEVVDFVERRE